MQEHTVHELKPYLIIHAAAERRPDVCEADDAGSEALNVEAVWYLGRAAARVGSRFIHISTDYVFDGTKPPYTEGDATNPLNAYGRQKLRGEFAALAAHPAPAILRIPVLFGPTNDLSESAITFFVGVVRDASKPVTLDDWQIRVPTFTPDIAQTLVRMANAMVDGSVPSEALRGIFHYSSNDTATRLGIARQIGDILGLPTSHITGSAEPPPGAPRPKHVKLEGSRLTDYGLAHPPTPFKDALLSILDLK